MRVVAFFSNGPSPSRALLAADVALLAARLGHRVVAVDLGSGSRHPDLAHRLTGGSPSGHGILAMLASAAPDELDEPPELVDAVVGEAVVPGGRLRVTYTDGPAWTLDRPQHELEAVLSAVMRAIGEHDDTELAVVDLPPGPSPISLAVVQAIADDVVLVDDGAEDARDIEDTMSFLSRPAHQGRAVAPGVHHAVVAAAEPVLAPDHLLGLLDDVARFGSATRPVGVADRIVAAGDCAVGDDSGDLSDAAPDDALDDALDDEGPDAPTEEPRLPRSERLRRRGLELLDDDDAEAAVPLLAEAVQLFTRAADTAGPARVSVGLAAALSNLARAYNDLGLVDEAARTAGESLALFRDHLARGGGHHLGYVLTAHEVARAAVGVGDDSGADEVLTDAMKTWTDLVRADPARHAVGAATTALLAAHVRERLGDPAGAVGLTEQAGQLYAGADPDEFDTRRDVHRCLARVAEYSLDHGDYRRAAQSAGRAADIVRELLTDPLHDSAHDQEVLGTALARNLLTRARAAHHLGDLDEAVLCADDARAACPGGSRASSTNQTLFRTVTHLSMYLLERGNRRLALDHARAAADFARYYAGDDPVTWEPLLDAARVLENEILYAS